MVYRKMLLPYHSLALQPYYFKQSNISVVQDMWKSCCAEQDDTALLIQAAQAKLLCFINSSTSND